MGVPKFYRWISERYPCLSETVKEFQIPEFDNLYLDMNGIIHVCSHPEDDNPHFRITEEKIFADIMYYIEFLFRMIKPRKVFFMAVDGVAPRAKMNQQRGRRFRSAREAEVLENKARDRGEVLPTEKRFDSNCITPGTKFMAVLQEQLKYFVVRKMSTDPLWHGVRVYLSGHETPGEGEHKVMDFIRAERSQPDYDPNTRHCLYGLDADLMMLGLATHDPHFSLLREEVRFGGKKDRNKRPATPEETTFHLLHLSLFREYLDFEFSALKEKDLGFPYDLEKIIDDWVMMGFLVGNDFIPHLPNLHINHDALPLLWQTYIDVLPSCGGYINNGGYLNLERFEKYLAALSKFDMDTFSDQAGDLKWLEGKKASKEAQRRSLLKAAEKLREKQSDMDTSEQPGDSRKKASLNAQRFALLSAASKLTNNQSDMDTSEQPGDSGKKASLNAQRLELLSAARKLRNNQRKSENQFASLISLDDDMDDIDDDDDDDDDIGTEFLESTEEECDEGSEDDTLDDEFRHHKRNYYMTKMEYEKVTPEVLRDQAEGYVRGIQWILLYYYEGVPSWSWFYPHHYAPYMSDVKDFSDMKIEFDRAKPFLPFEQLMAVLPAASRDLLPKAFQALMTTDSSPVIDFYPSEFDTDLNGKQQDWEAVVLIPFIDEKRLLDAMKTAEYLMTEEERNRNIHGPCLLYQYTPESQGVYPSSIPGVFPDIAFNHSKLTEVRLDEFWLKSEDIVKGLLPGAQLDVFYPGFPTLKHIKYKAELKKEGVKVFQMNSRGFNVMLHIEEEEEEPDIEQVSKEYLGKEIYVGWPHLYEAKVIRVCNEEESFASIETPAKGGKSQKTSPRMQVQRETVDKNTANIWEREATTIAERYKERLGVIVGSTSILVKALPMTGRKYLFGSQGRVTTEKQFGTYPVTFALQTTVKDIAVHNPDVCPYKSLQDYLPEKAPVFMIGWPHYGCQGEVIEVDNTENGRVRINITILEEPNVSKIMNNQQSHSEQYFPSYVAAQRLGISSNFVSRITGTVRVIQKGDQAVDVGLNLKFTKRQEEVPGYTKMFEGQWTYSEKALNTVREYMQKFPEMFDAISNSKKHNDNFSEDEIFPDDCGYKLSDVSKYIKSLPCSGLKLVKSGSDIISEGVVSALENEAKRTVDINRKRQKRVKLQVKPHLLYRPMPKQGALVPDSSTQYKLFDRVVNVREGFSVPFGLRGTVVGIYPAEVEVNTMYEVLFDEEFHGGISIRSSSGRGYRMPPSGLLNITHGERKNGVKPMIAPQTQGIQSNNFQGAQNFRGSQNIQGNQSSQGNQNFEGSQNFLGNQLRNSNWFSYSDLCKNGSPQAAGSSNYGGQQAGNQLRNYHDNRGGYANQNRGSDSNMYNGVGGWAPVNQDRNQQSGRGRGRGQQNWNRSQQENKPSQRQETLAGQVFNGKGSGQPAFVTPRVNAATSRRSSQGEGQTSKPSASQESSAVNSEFENMWKVLKGDSTSSETQEKSHQKTGSVSDKGTALSQAAASLPKVPSPATDNMNKNENNNQGASTKIDVENLFSQASKVQGNDEFSAMFNSLELSNQQKLAAKGENIETGEDGSVVIKKMLHIDEIEETENSADTQEVSSSVPSGGGGKSYGKQVSIQELFDGAKQKLDTETKSQDVSPPQQKSQNKQQKKQRQQSHQQQQNQKRPNLLAQYSGGRNPVMELMTFCQSLQIGLPMYDYNPKNGMFFCVVSFVTGARFQGSLCKSREEAAESAAGVALLQMKSSMQHMAAQTMMRFPGGVPGMMPQGRQFSSPNSAFSPVQGFYGQGQYPQRGQYPMYNQRPQSGGQKSQQQYQRGSYRPQNQQSANQDTNYKNQPQNNQGKTYSANENQSNKAEVAKSTSQNATNKLVTSGSQSAEVKTCVVNPFVPLQVVKKQTPQKSRKESQSESKGEKMSKEDNSADSLTKGDKSTDNSSKVDKSSELSNANISTNDDSDSAVRNKIDSISKHSDKYVDKNVSEPPSGQTIDSGEITPQKLGEQAGSSATPGKPKSKRRLAANFSFGNPTP